MAYKRAGMVRIQFELEPDLKREFEERVREEGYTMSGLVRKWMKEYLKKKK